MEVVVVIGASSDSSRYSYKAVKMLSDHGHEVLPVHPREELVLGKKVTHDLGDLVGKKVDTVTVYVNAAITDKYEKDLVALHPKRVIFNPGAENPRLSSVLVKQGISVENACTLVLLSTGQF